MPLLVTVWVALATQPTRGHVTNWSHDLGIGGVVSDLGVHVSVLAFGACVVVARWPARSLRRRARHGGEPDEIATEWPTLEPPSPLSRNRTSSTTTAAG